MLSSREKMITASEESREKLAILQMKYLLRFRDYIIRLEEYKKTDMFECEREYITHHIRVMNSLHEMLRLHDRYDSTINLSQFLDEATLSWHCAYYDELMKRITFKEQEKTMRLCLNNQFEGRINRYIGKLMEILGSVNATDTIEIKRINGYIAQLNDVRSMLCDNAKPLSIDENTLNQDCAFLDKLIQTSAPRVMEDKARRAILKERVGRLQERLSSLQDKLPSEAIIRTWRTNLRALTENLYDNTPINPDEINDHCAHFEEECKKIEQTCEETPQLKKFKK